MRRAARIASRYRTRTEDAGERELPIERDRRFEGLFDGLVTMLVAEPGRSAIRVNWRKSRPSIVASTSAKFSREPARLRRRRRESGVGATTIAVKLIEQLPAPAERVIVDADLSGRRSVAVLYDARPSSTSSGCPARSVSYARSGPFVMELARTHEDAFIQNADSVVEAIERLPEDAVIVVDAPQPFAAPYGPLSRGGKDRRDHGTDVVRRGSGPLDALGDGPFRHS